MPLLLDLFCCAGGAASGYARAGFEVVGIDLDPQPHYPYEFFQWNALDALDDLLSGYAIGGYALDNFSAIHASPPCQLFSVYNNVKRTAASTAEKYQDLIEPTRQRLIKTGLPYIIENVPKAPLKDPARLCGTSFEIPVRRHRMFETNWDVEDVPQCDHKRFTERRFPGSSNRPNGRTVCNVGEYRVPLNVQKECMQVDWTVTLHELSEMVPPVFTEFLGSRLLK